MKTRSVRVAGALAFFAFAIEAQAAFRSMTREAETVTIDGSPGFVIREYAVFDCPNDRLVGVSDVTITAPPGMSLFQHSLGSSTAPLGFLLVVPEFESLQHDSFVTIGLASVPPGGSDSTVLDSGSGFTAGGFHGGWHASADAPQTLGEAIAGTAYYRVLIGQFSFNNVPSGATLASGEVTLHWQSADGKSHETATSFCDAPMPLSGPWACEVGIGDINLDGLVNGVDLAQLLAAWGPCPAGGAPCPADIFFIHDQHVNGLDLAELLARWTPTLNCGR